MTTVAILGCGPSGLAAAQGAINAGVPQDNITIFSKGSPEDANDTLGKWVPRKSEVHGAQYLHEPIPGIDCGIENIIAIKFIGSVDGYRKKVYGPDYVGMVSPQEFYTPHSAWDLRAAYDHMWKIFEDNILEVDFDPLWFAEPYADLVGNFDLAISTIPRRQLCVNPEHSFKSQLVYAIGDAPSRGVKCPVSCEPNTLVYNGDLNYGWYRTSNIFGHTTAEWGANQDRAKPPISNLATVEKPLSSNCNCWPGLHFLGRYGAWKKGILVHHVYRAAIAQAALISQEGSQGALF